MNVVNEVCNSGKYASPGNVNTSTDLHEHAANIL